MDEIDWKIMDRLLRDARTPLSEIGSGLSLGKDTITKRVQKLHKRGILGSPTIILDSKKCGFEGIIDFFIKYNSEPKDQGAIINQLSELPYILSIAKTIGDYNLYFSSFFRNINDINEIVSLIKEIAEISHFEMLFHFQEVSNPLFLPFLEDDPERSIIYKIQSKNQT